MPTIDQVVASRRPRIEPASVQAVPHGQAGQQGERNGQAPQRPQWEKTFIKSSLVNVTGSETNINRHGQPEGTVGRDEVIITAPLREQFTIALSRYVRRLADIQRKNPTALSGVHHEFDNQLMNTLIGPNGQPSEENIHAFLEDERNWAIARVAMQQHAFRLYSAMGMMQIDRLRGERVHVTDIDERTIRLGADQGAINRPWYEYVVPFLQHNVNEVADRPDPNRPRETRWQSYLRFVRPGLRRRWVGNVAVSTAIGAGVGVFMANPIAGLAAGVAAYEAGVPLATFGVRKLLKDGLIVDRRRSGQMFEAMRSDPEELKFMSELTGINLENYRYDALTGRIVLRAGFDYEEMKNPEEVLEEAAQVLYAVQEFDVTWTGKSKSLDAMVEEFILAPSANPRERHNVQQTGFKIDEELNRRFFSAAVGGVNPANMVESIQRWYRNRARFLTEEWRRMGDEKRGEAQREKRIESLQAQIDKFETTKQERIDRHTKNKLALESDQQSLSAETTAVETYQKKVTGRRRGLDMVQRTAIANRDRIVGRIALPAGATVVDAINTLRESTRANVDVNVDNVLIESPFERMRLVRIARNAPTGVVYPAVPVGAGGAPPTQEQIALYTDQRGAAERDETRIRAERQSEYDRVKGEVDADIARINELITQLEGVRNIPEPTEEQAPVPTDEETKAAEKVLHEAMPDAFAMISEWETTLAAVVRGPGGVGLTEANLMTETVEQLLTRINQAHERNNSFGWPANQNKNPELRAQLIHAMAEARARAESPEIANPPLDTFVTLHDTAPFWDITEHELLTLSRDQIRQIMITRHDQMPGRYRNNPSPPVAGVAGGISNEQIEEAIEIARLRLNARSRGLEQVQAAVKQEAEHEKIVADNIDLHEPLERYKLAHELFSNRGEINRKSGEMANTRDTFFDQTPIIPGPEHTPSMIEQYTPAGGVLQHYERGYLEILQEFFDYRRFSDLDERNRAFQQARELVPPEVVAVAISSHLGPGVLPTPNLTATFHATRVALNAGSARWTNIREALEEIIGHVVIETRNLRV